MPQVLENPAKKLVIFDWDGTLVDSVSDIVDGLCHAASQFSIPLTRHAAQQVIGLALPEAMQVLFPDHPELHDQIIQAYSAYYLQHATTRPFAGVPALLASLQAQGVPMAIATGKSRAGLDRVMPDSGLADYFTATRTASETASKPDPKMLHELMQALNVQAADCIMVGDSSYDLDMARRAGMQSVGVTYGVHDAAQLAPFSPLATVDSVEALQKTLMAVLYPGVERRL